VRAHQRLHDLSAGFVEMGWKVQNSSSANRQTPA
jgi:hypothetical protein